MRPDNKVENANALQRSRRYFSIAGKHNYKICVSHVVSGRSRTSQVMPALLPSTSKHDRLAVCGHWSGREAHQGRDSAWGHDTSMYLLATHDKVER